MTHYAKIFVSLEGSADVLLFGGTVPPTSVLFRGTVPPACLLFGGTVPPKNQSQK